MLQKYQLRNGLKVVMVQNSKAPVVSVQAWVKTGSADETKGIEGISHFIEHLVFKGSEKYGVGEIAQRVEGAGGQLNAYTSFDQTVFYITISKEFTSTALDMISQMMGYPTFDPKEIDNEREVVIEEIKRSNDSLSRVASQNMFSTVFKKHAYGIPVIGYDKVIRKVTPKKIKEYYHARYSPKNMTLIVTGDFEGKELKSEIKKHFEKIPSYKVKTIKRKKEPAQKTPRLMVKNTKFQESRFQISWKIPHALHKDTPALDLMSAVLGQSETSRLIKTIKNEKGLVQFIFSSSYTPVDEGLFSISAGLEAENLKPVLDEILIAMKSLFEGNIDVSELKTAVTNFENEEIYSKQTVDGIANHVGHYMFLTGDPEYSKKLNKKLRAITTKDLIDVAKKYLKPEGICISAASNTEAKKLEPLFKSFVNEYKKLFSQVKRLKPIKGKKPKMDTQKFNLKELKNPKVKKHILSSGTELLVYQTSDVPLFHIQLAALGGARVENEKNMGLGNLLSNVWVSGTDTLSESQLHGELERISASISAFSGRNSMGLKMTTLSKYQKEALNLYFDVLLTNKLEESILNRERKQILTSIRNRVDNPSHLASQNFMEMMFPGHPYSFDLEGKISTIESLTKKNLLDFKAGHLVGNNMKVVIVGAIDKAAAIKLIESKLQKVEKGMAFNKTFSFPELKSNKESHQLSEKEQTHVFIGYQGLIYTDPEKYVLYVINSILAGQGGRLFLELRDKESLAYSVSPLHMEGIDGGYFGGYIACSPEKTTKAIRMLREEFQKLCDHQLSDDELARAKRSLIGRHDISLQKNSSIASTVLFDRMYGMSEKEYILFKDKIKAVTAEQVMTIAKRIFSRPEVLAVVGKK
jgi:zinc protease